MRDKPFWRSRWWMPLFSLALGAAMFTAYAIGDAPGDGAFAFGVMAALAALFFFGGRSETLRGLGGPGRDERWAAIDLRASAFAGLVLITAVIGAFLYEIASGRQRPPAPTPSSARSPGSPTSSPWRCSAGARSYFA